jgi:hypothetical protein
VPKPVAASTVRPGFAPGRTQLVHTSLAVAQGAEQLEVGEIVAAAGAERNAMVDLEASVRAAADADAVACMDARP